MDAPSRTRRLLGRRAEARAQRVGRAGRISGRARLGKRTKDLVKKLHAGEIAVIDHPDLDRIAAEDLAASGVAAVLNNSASSTDHYPNVGPVLLARAGVPLIDFTEGDLFELLDDGEAIELDGPELLRDGADPGPR